MDKHSVRVILAHNLKALMKRSVDLRTQQALAKRAGMSQRTVSNLLRADAAGLNYPTLDKVEKVAQAFGMATWQILLDPRTFGEDVAALLMRPPVQDEDPRIANPRWDASSKPRVKVRS